MLLKNDLMISVCLNGNSSLFISDASSRQLVTAKGLVTNYREGGGATKREGGGGAREFYPYEKGRGGKSFSHSEWGVQKVLG